MKIRLARHKDVSELIRLYHHLSARYQDNPAAIEAAFLHPSTFVYVVEKNGAIVGTATLSVRVVPCKGFFGYVDDVVVDPSCVRQGIAAALMNHLIDSARELECVEVHLTSNSNRVAANRLYEKLGFGRYATNVYALLL